MKPKVNPARNVPALPSTLLVLIAAVLAAPAARSEEVIKGQGFEITLPAGWKPLATLPQGFDVGFQRTLKNGKATVVFHHEVMPSEAGEPPSDTSDMRRQWNAMVMNQYPDAAPVRSPEPKVNGRLLINAVYDLTDSGEKVRRRYTYFLSGRTAFVVQCSASPKAWEEALPDFDRMTGALVPRKSGKPQTVADPEALSKLRRDIPTLLGSFPAQWSSKLDQASIVATTDRGQRVLDIKLRFHRKDIEGIYGATKYLFTAMKEGKSDADLQGMPSAVRNAAPHSADFMKYVGQAWGAAWGFVANCDPPIEGLRVSIATSNGKRVGAISVSREDAATILSGKVDASQTRRVAAMYHFE